MGLGPFFLLASLPTADMLECAQVPRALCATVHPLTLPLPGPASLLHHLRNGNAILFFFLFEQQLFSDLLILCCIYSFLRYFIPTAVSPPSTSPSSLHLPTPDPLLLPWECHS